MTFKRRLKKPTKAEQKRQDKARELGCIACWMRGLDPEKEQQCGLTSIHHLTECGFTQSQRETIALGAWHHQGTCFPRHTSSMMTAKFGPSLAKGTVPFYEAFGRNPELLEFQNAMLNYGPSSMRSSQ